MFLRLANGAAVPKIAAELNLSTSTVGTHLYNIKQKLHAGNQAELTLIALRAGLIEISGGSSESDVNDWHVNPSGSEPGSSLSAVTTTTPDAKAPIVARMAWGVMSWTVRLWVLVRVVMSSTLVEITPGHYPLQAQ